MQLNCSTGNFIVDQMTKIEIKGNIIPQIWTKTICYKDGKPNWNAIMILGDIVYWYKPSEVRDEAQGFIGYKKKFKSDLLQRSYSQIMDIYQMSESQARRGVKALEDLGVVIRHFRDVTSAGGIKAHNVMYLELVPQRLYELTYPILNKEMSVTELTYGDIDVDMVSASKLTYESISENTNTIITTEITSRNPPSINHSVSWIDRTESYTEIIRYNIEYNNLIMQFGSREKALLEEVVSVMVDLVVVERKVVRIGKIDYPYQLVKNQILKLRGYHIENVIKNLMKNKSKKTNMRGYLVTTLYNASMTTDNSLQSEANYNF